MEHRSQLFKILDRLILISHNDEKNLLCLLSLQKYFRTETVQKP